MSVEQHIRIRRQISTGPLNVIVNGICYLLYLFYGESIKEIIKLNYFLIISNY